MNRILQLLTIALVGCATTPAPLGQAPAPEPADSDIRNAFDRVDQSVPYQSDF